jgi:phospholipid-transporting ATPase
MRELSESQLKRFLDMYKEADLLISDRQSRTDKVTELLESDLTLLGATAVEDKLQDQV